MMTPARLLVLNAGSSSVKFALYEAGGASLANTLRGQLAGIGRDATFSVQGAHNAPSSPATPPTLTLPRKGGGDSFFTLLLEGGGRGGGRAAHQRRSAEPTP